MDLLQLAIFSDWIIIFYNPQAQPTEPMTATLAVLWDDYVTAESRHERRTALRQLQVIIDTIGRLPTPRREQWVETLCHKMEAGAHVPLRHPLVEQLLAPTLSAWIADRRPHAARWAAHILGEKPGLARCFGRLGPGALYPGELSFLRMALEHDPNDRRARQRCILLLADDLDSTVHEVRAEGGGVLYGSNGASRHECTKLLADLEYFRTLVRKERQSEEYAGLIAYCGFHDKTYLEWLDETPHWRTYTQYVADECSSIASRGLDAEGGVVERQIERPPDDNDTFPSSKI